MQHTTLPNTPEHKAALDREQLMLFVQLRGKTYVAVGLALIITWSLWDDLALQYLLPWMTLVILSLFARFMVTPSSMEGLGDEEITRGTYWAWFYTMVSCAIWGIGAAIFMGQLTLMKQVLLIVLLVGQTGAVLGYVTDKKYSFVVHLLTVPLLLWLFLQEQTMYRDLGYLILLYIVFMQFSLGAQYQRFARTVLARFEREALLEKLQQEMVEKEAVELQLREKSKDAIAANRAKTNFISVVSHELRTPVHGLIGMLDLLNGARLDKEARLDLKSARRAARNLRVLVNDILDLSKAEAGKMELHIAPFQIQECVHDAMMPCTLLAKKQDTSVAVEFVDVPSVIDGDAGKIRQVLLNLIGNAVKFTERGEVLVVVKVVGDKRLSFRVQDTGIGIKKEDLLTIFEPFVQVKAHMEQQHDGTGLGISIADKFVEQMGGKLRVESVVGEGTSFYFDIACEMKGALVKREVDMIGKQCFLPSESEHLHTVDTDKSEKSVAMLSDASLKKVGKQWKVLVAEDDPISRRIAVKRLGRVGFEVVAAADGAIAWSLLQQGSFDLILLDIRMPGMDGITLAKHIRHEDNPNQDVPIIGLSAHATKQVMDECLEVGMNEFLMKPIDPSVIVQKMQQVLSD